MAHIPQDVLDRQPPLQGLKLRGRGKVRDSYELPNFPGLMMPVASNRCSIFDFVLNTEIPFKGEVLTALSCFSTQEVLKDICDTDLIACGAEINGYLPLEHAGNPELQKVATIVTLLNQPEVESIVRLYLTGSGWKSYREDGTVCGHRLPKGLRDGSRLPYSIFAPTTKAAVGHDEHITADSVAERYGIGMERLSLQAAMAMSAFAEKRGIILADTKFEWSGGTLVDEKCTPDSSRFWDKVAWQKAQAAGKLPPSFDKQFVREWGKSVGIDDRLDPTNPEHLKHVDNAQVPPLVVTKTTRLYRYIFWRLTGMKLETYQRTRMGISVKTPIPNVTILVGSDSDLHQTIAGCDFLKASGVNFSLNVVSCHRNPELLRQHLMEIDSDTNIIIAGAGKAAALPGIVKSWLCHFKRPEIPVIGVAFESKSVSDKMAAMYSIENLPEQPVELNSDGKAYFGSEGFVEACKAALENEFLPKNVTPKAARFNI